MSKKSKDHTKTVIDIGELVVVVMLVKMNQVNEGSNLPYFTIMSFCNE